MSVQRIVYSVVCVLFFSNAFSQNVGINTTTPAYPLDVNGDVITSGNVYVNGKLGFGTTSPQHTIHMIDGSMGFTSSVDNITWVFGYNSASNYLFMAEDGNIRAVMKTGGNIGINTTTPSYRLDVNGTIHTSSNLLVNGNLTVNNGKGIIQNSQGSGQLKYYTRSVTLTTGNMAGFALGTEFSIPFNGASFSAAPTVTASDIVSASGTGDGYHVQLIIYGATSSGCKAKLINTSPNAVDQTITWNLVCVGE